VNGCTDCHSYDAGFFMSQVVKMPFNSEGDVVTDPQYKILGLSPLKTYTGILRESYLKPVLYTLLLVFLVLLVITGFRYLFKNLFSKSWLNILSIGFFAGIVFVLVWVLSDQQLALYMLPSRLQLDGNHFITGIVIMLAILLLTGFRISRKRNLNSLPAILKDGLNLYLLSCMIVIGFSGILLLVNAGWIFYSVFDLSLLLAVAGCIEIPVEIILDRQVSQVSS
jgi:hypothetical protein